MKLTRKSFSILAALLLSLTVFTTPASASDNPGSIPGLTGRVTGSENTYPIAPGSSLEKTFDCLHDAAAVRGDGAGCWR